MRQFLDAQRIPNLAYYLEELHKADGGLHATKEHTTLLLHCYTKQKDAAKLAAFVSGEDGTFGGAAGAAATAAAGIGGNGVSSARSNAAGNKSSESNGSGNNSSSGGSALAFDVETAIEVLRASGQDAHALTLAKRIVHPKQHDWVMQLCLKMAQDSSSSGTNTSGASSSSSSGRSSIVSISRRHSSSAFSSSSGGARNAGNASFMDEALQYLRSLPLPVAAQLCCTYGRPLLAALPDQTTHLLIDLCTGSFQSTTEASTNTSPTSPAGPAATATGKEAELAAATVANAEQYLPLFVDQSEHLQRFLAAVLTAALEADHANSSSSGGGSGGNPTASSSSMMTSSSSLSLSSSATLPPSAANTLLELLLRTWTEAAETAAHPYKRRRALGASAGGAGGRGSPLLPPSMPSSSSSSSSTSFDPLSVSAVNSNTSTGSSQAAAAPLPTTEEDEQDEVEIDPEALAAAAAEASRCVMDLLKAPRTAAPYDRYHALVLTQVWLR